MKKNNNNDDKRNTNNYEKIIRRIKEILDECDDNHLIELSDAEISKMNTSKKKKGKLDIISQEDFGIKYRVKGYKIKVEFNNDLYVYKISKKPEEGLNQIERKILLCTEPIDLELLMFNASSISLGTDHRKTYICFTIYTDKSKKIDAACVYQTNKDTGEPVYNYDSLLITKKEHKNGTNSFDIRFNNQTNKLSVLEHNRVPSKDKVLGVFQTLYYFAPNIKNLNSQEESDLAK